MTSQVFYRKWRPQTLAEVVGQEHVTRTLRNALETGRVAHAYLFCGPRGTGKTSTGRILAKAINCFTNGKGEPCNTCEMCQAITRGSALDIVEIDAASNRKIDDIRDLRERVRFAPAAARYKVYIIDEVHMLTTEASNALLKTLEEPPPQTVFILATTEPHKMLPTILSRCQRFDFRKLSQGVVVSKLMRVCEEEGIAVEPQGLGLIARSVSGSLRDAENVLQQLVTYYGNQIDTHQVEDMLGVTSDSRVRELARHIVEKDISAGLATINSVAGDGIDLLQFNRGLVDYLRSMLWVKSGAAESAGVASADLAEMEELTGRMSVENLVQALRLFGEVDLRSKDYSSLPLELALVECILAGAGDMPGHDESPVARKKERPPARSPVREKAIPADPPVTVSSAEPERAPASPALGPQSEIELVRSQWTEFVDTLRGVGSGGNVDAFLRSACEPEAVEGDTLVLAFYHMFHKDKIEDPKYCRMVEKKLAEKFGNPSKVRCVLRPKAEQRPTEGHLVKAALEMGGRITSVVEDASMTGGEKQ
jgi:DNA polymerase-3 subunit gamma/tau